MTKSLYAAVTALRDAEWNNELPPHAVDEPETPNETKWYHQGRVEAFAEIMTLLERLACETCDGAGELVVQPSPAWPQGARMKCPTCGAPTVVFEPEVFRA